MNQNTLISVNGGKHQPARDPQIYQQKNELFAHSEEASDQRTSLFGKVQDDSQRHGIGGEGDMMAVDLISAAPSYGGLQNGQQFDEDSRSSPSKASSPNSHKNNKEGRPSISQQRVADPPLCESQYEQKTSFDSFTFSSGGKDNNLSSQNISSERIGQQIHLDQETPTSREERQTNCQEMQRIPQILSTFTEDQYHLPYPSCQGDTFSSGERLRRSCRDKTTKYSQLQKGGYNNFLAPDRENKKSKKDFQQPDKSKGRERNLSQSEQTLGETNEEQMHAPKPYKRASARTAEDCLETFKSMLAFDWDLKEIANLKHSPQQELTHSIFWFYVNSQYFPFRALQTSEKSFEEFARPVLQNLKPLNQQEELKSNDEQLQNNQEDCKLTATLLNDKKFAKFKKLYKDLQERALQESFKKQEPACETQAEIPSNENETMNDEECILEKQQVNKFETMIDVLKKEIETLSDSNRSQLQTQFADFKEVYQHAKSSEAAGDPVVYQQDNMLEYDQSFLAQVDPGFVKDLQINSDWYLENFNEILLNVGYPSRKEKDFLKHIEQVQQRNNDQKYKKILNQIEQGIKGGPAAVIEDENYQNLSMHKRALVNQEDAQCAICNSGDYEDEDLIVFCGNCNLPVHQSCYGIDHLPEGDWICYNCDIFGFRKGLQVACLVCPKKGGAMKPTNIFTTKQNQLRYTSANSGGKSHKKGGSSKKNLPPALSDKQDTCKPSMSEREDKTISLTLIIKREFEYQAEIRAQQEELMLQGQPQTNDVELHFDLNEKERQIPDDYNFFIQRNEPRLESHLSSQAETLYEWVHHSCASWTPGPLVTPRTPVRLNKLDEKRFSLQCIICLKKVGACMQCQAPRCTISFHVECARRANYCMELDKRDSRDKTYRMFCEKHRPLKIVKEMEEKERQTVEEIQKFCKVIEKCAEIDQRSQLKQVKNDKESRGPQGKQTREEKGDSAKGKLKKWREKDKKGLFERVKEKFLLFRKMRVNLVKVDPCKKQKKQQKQKKRNTKRQNKIASHRGGCRQGLRSQPGSFIIPKSDSLELFSEQVANATEENYEMNYEDNKEQSNLDTYNQELGFDDTAQEPYYKISTPINPAEIDWTITLSRNDFPWFEIKFGNFTAKECFEKYQSIVRDSSTFLKKVLGLKEKYKKMMENQIHMAQQPQTIIIPLQGGGSYDNSVYCRCQGTVNNDFFVKCDADEECPNGGWLHPQCTTDLRGQKQSDLENMEEWYCEDCVHRIHVEEEEDRIINEIKRLKEAVNSKSSDMLDQQDMFERSVAHDQAEVIGNNLQDDGFIQRTQPSRVNERLSDQTNEQLTD